MVGDS